MGKAYRQYALILVLVGTFLALSLPSGLPLQPALSPQPDHPGDLEELRRLQEQDEHGFIPPDGLLKASQKLQAMRAEKAPRRATDGIAPDNLGPFEWTWLGPGNIGGRIRSILIHPTTPNTMWVGGVAGGVWKTTNGGASWTPTTDFLANLAISSLVMDPGNYSVLYAGTGEGFGNYDAIRGGGVFKTTNGGSNWSQLSSTDNPDWDYVNRLAVNRYNGQVLLAATGTGTFRTIDGGTSWTQELFTRTLDVKFSPTSAWNAVAGGAYGDAWYSINGGVNWTMATWSPVESDAGRVELAYAPSNTSVVYASVEKAPGGSSNGNYLYKSTDGGHSYTLVNSSTNYLGKQGWYGNAIWVDPTNANTLIVGGIDLWRSTNGGVNLSQISQWDQVPNSAHADHHVIVAQPGFDGSTNKTVFFGNDGGIYKTTDVYNVALTSGWQELNNNLGITQFLGAAGNSSTGVIVGGTQDNGTLRYVPASGPQGWDSMSGGDGGYSAADPTNSNYFYGEYVNLQIHRSSDGGATSEYIDGAYWTGSYWAWKNAPYKIEDARIGWALFIAPFVLDPNNVNRILAGGIYLWRTNDAKTANTTTTGPSWASIKNPDSDGQYYYYISAVTVAPSNPDIIYVGHANGHLYKTNNGTAANPTWTRVDTNSPGLPGRWILRVTVDPNNPNIVYVTYGGFSPSNVWRSADGGNTWTDIAGTGLNSGDLPQVPVRSLVVHPRNSSRLYLGTEVGIFTSNDSGRTWSTTQDGPANVSVDELFFMNTPTNSNANLIAATHGRGVYSSPAFTIITPGSGFPLQAGACNNPNPLILVKVTKPAPGLTKDSFSVTIGGKPATISAFFEYPDEYRLYVVPPKQAGVGRYDLTVIHPLSWLVGLWDSEPNAVNYTGTSCSQVYLPLVTSGYGAALSSGPNNSNFFLDDVSFQSMP